MNDFIERKRRSPSPTSALSAQDARARIRRAVIAAHLELWQEDIGEPAPAAP